VYHFREPGRVRPPFVRRSAAFRQSGGESRSFPLVTQGPFDPAQNLYNKRSGSAGGIEDPDVWVREPICDEQLGSQRTVDPLDHVLHDLDGRVPDTHLTSQFRIEGFEEGLVKILYGMLVLESGEEGSSIDAVKCL